MLDDNMRRLSGESGAKNRRKAAQYWQALIAAKRPEEPPAFDVEESGRSLVDDLYGENVGERAEQQAPVPPTPEPKAPKAPRARKARAPDAAAERQVPAYEGAEDDDDIEPMAATTGDEP